MIQDPWLPYEPVRVYTERSPENYWAALRQFDVEHAVRYQVWNKRTFCNIFVWDGTRALGCEIPHWVDKDGTIVKPFSYTSWETTANILGAQWLPRWGAQYGWKRCEKDDGEDRARRGLPVVLSYVATVGPGHVAFLMPNGNVYQAGAKNGEFPVGEVFGKLLYTTWTHD